MPDTALDGGDTEGGVNKNRNSDLVGKKMSNGLSVANEIL